MNRKHSWISALLSPVKRGLLCMIFAGSWWLAAEYLIFTFLPNFNVYNNYLTRSGNTSYDVFLIWAWIPSLTILILGCIFWASGLAGRLWDVIADA